ncbi:TetR/AcrR family transcriptional regulator [Pseudonocardia sp. RS010]|uniref:TetR/AcrR family transcriptional regulator n=1 Tax=Pseudonocardia sp. RS010 TaxID=3385979 RepID=UPI0039A099EB
MNLELPQPRSAKGRATLKELLRAGDEILRRDGYAGARVSDISNAAGLSNGAFYRYFDDKRHLLLHVIHDFLRYSEEYVHVTFDPEHPMASVRESTERYMRFYAQHADMWRAVIEAGQNDPDVEALRNEVTDAWCARIARMLHRAQKAGLVRADLDCDVASFLLGGMMQFYAQHAFRPDSTLETDPGKVAGTATALWESGAFVTGR